MSDQHIPAEITALASERQAARERRDWPEADRLRADIEAAGYKVIDQATSFRLSRAHPPTIFEDGRTRYGSADDVPSRLGDEPHGEATVVLVATNWPTDLARAVGRLADTSPDGTQIVIVAADPSDDQAEWLAELETLEPGSPGVRTEIVWLSAPVGHAAALNAGIRRASAPIVVLLDTSVEPTGDIVSPLVDLLDDPDVVVAGAFGTVSSDLRHFEDAPNGDVDAIDGRVLAFRRADYVERGPLDEKFRFARYLDVWWSLVLRDRGEGSEAGRAVAVELPVVRHEDRANATMPEPERDRLSKRNFYRVLDRFGWRRDLLVTARPAGTRPKR